MHDLLYSLHCRVARALPLTLRRHYLHLMEFRRPADLTTPRTFNEKTTWRILHDRRRMIVDACDKLRMKEMARERVPGSELRIPRTFWSGTDLADAPDLDDVGPWVLKSNNGCGEIVFGPTPLAPLRDTAAGWLTSDCWTVYGEWGYSEVVPRLFIEERIPSESPVPTDYKVFVYDGVPSHIQVNSGRFSGDEHLTWYDTDWNRIDVRRKDFPQADEPRPAPLARMLDIAARLGQGWDFIRIDLYVTGDDVWMGEYSPYHCGGLFRFDPPEADLEYGRRWTLPTSQDGSRAGADVAERASA